jgi:hypothetical protein
MLERTDIFLFFIFRGLNPLTYSDSQLTSKTLNYFRHSGSRPDRPITLPVPTHNSTTQKFADIDATAMPLPGVDTMIPVFERPITECIYTSQPPEIKRNDDDDDDDDNNNNNNNIIKAET